jgi:hypothetical protein
VSLLQPLNLPPYPFRITDDKGQLFVFDEIRKKQIMLTPEEWVRQHFVQYLIKQKNYPRSLIKLEGGLKLNGMARRSDIVLHNSAGEKILLIECKAPYIPVDQKVFDQAARYNMVYRVPLLAVSNGLVHHCAKIDFEKNSYSFLKDLPDYKQLKSLNHG